MKYFFVFLKINITFVFKKEVIMNISNNNEAIQKCLNDYLRISKPGYALLIKGPWGCGKTYFIKKWLETLKESNKDNDNGNCYTLEPIYVSLYGISSSIQIDEEIKKAVSPILHSKIMKKAGKIFNLAISAAIHYKIDIDKDGVNDVICTIDHKALLGSNTSYIKGNKLLVFDDLERSKMNIKELLGYINYYVEHIGCNVVIVGDDSQLLKCGDYKSTKEKTIGREFYITPNVDTAVDAIVTDGSVLCRDYLHEKMEIIKACFKASDTNNLRVLKQSLDDFALLTDRIANNIAKNSSFEIIKPRLLANFIAVYAEYKSQNIDIDYSKKLADENISLLATDNIKNDGQLYGAMARIHEKYRSTGLTDKYFTMEPQYVDFVLEYLNKGKVDLEFVNNEIRKEEKNPWDLLINYTSMENDELEKNIDLNAGYLESGNFESANQMLTSALAMLFVIHNNLSCKYNTNNVINWCVKIIKEKYYGNCKTQNELYKMRNQVFNSLNYYTINNKIEEINTLIDAINKVYQEVSDNLNNDLTIMLESLDNNKINDLYRIYGGTLPDHSATYSMSPIFAKVSPQKFVTSYVALSNYSKKQVITLIDSHYKQALYIKNLEEMVHYYIDDLKTLPKIIQLLEEESKTHYSVDKININELKIILENSVEKMEKANSKRNKETIDSRILE